MKSLLARVVFTIAVSAALPTAAQPPAGPTEPKPAAPRAAAGAERAPEDAPPPPFQASLVFIKADWSQAPAAKEIEGELRKALEDVSAPQELLDKLPASGPQILFPPEIVSHYSAERYYELLEWLKANALLQKITSFPLAVATVVNRPSGLSEVIEAGKLPPGAYYAHRTHLALPYDALDVPPIASMASQPFVKREMAWTWNVSYNNSGNKALDVTRLLAPIEHARGQEPKQLDPVDASAWPIQPLARGKVAVVNAFPSHFEGTLREAARRRGYELLLIIERLADDGNLPDAGAAEKTYQPRLALPDEVHRLKVDRPRTYPWQLVTPVAQEAKDVDPFAAVGPLANKAEAKEVKVFQLQHVDSEAVGRLLQQIYGTELALAGASSMDAKESRLVVRGSPELLKEVEALVMRLDRAPEAGERGSKKDADGERERGGDGESGLGPRSPSRSVSPSKPFGSPMGAMPGMPAGMAPGGMSGMPGGEDISGMMLSQSPDELRKQYESLEKTAAELAVRARREQAEHKKATSGPGPARMPPSHEGLHDAVARAFAARQRLHRAELVVLEQRLKSTRETLTLRERIQEKIIERRVEELLNPALQWSPEPASQGAVEAKPATKSAQKPAVKPDARAFERMYTYSFNPKITTEHREAVFERLKKDFPGVTMNSYQRGDEQFIEVITKDDAVGAKVQAALVQYNKEQSATKPTKDPLRAVVWIEAVFESADGPEHLEAAYVNGAVISHDGLIALAIDPKTMPPLDRLVSAKVTLNDERVVEGRLVACDPKTNAVGIIKVEATSLPFLELSTEPIVKNRWLKAYGWHDLTDKPNRVGGFSGFEASSNPWSKEVTTGQVTVQSVNFELHGATGVFEIAKPTFKIHPGAALLTATGELAGVTGGISDDKNSIWAISAATLKSLASDLKKPQPSEKPNMEPTADPTRE